MVIYYFRSIEKYYLFIRGGISDEISLCWLFEVYIIMSCMEEDMFKGMIFGIDY